MKKDQQTGSQGDITEKYYSSSNKESLVFNEKLGDAHRRKSLDAASNSNINIRNNE